MKVVTICGSMKFKDKMMEVARDLEIKNKYVVIQCVYSNDKFNEEEQVLLADLHYKKIDISDAIYVVNVDGYIGTSTKKEIEYAKSLNKEIVKIAKKEKVNYINVYDLLKDENDNLKLEYTRDGIHLTNEAYEIVTKKIKESIL